MRTFLASSLCLICSFAASGLSADPQTDLDQMLSDDYSCSSGSASVIDMHELSMGADKFLNKCIVVQGYVEGRWLLETQDEAATLSFDELEKRAPNFIGIQWNPKSAGPLKGLVQIIGRVRSCSDRYSAFQAAENYKTKLAGDAMPAPAVMLSGTCHYLNVAIFVSDWKAI